MSIFKRHDPEPSNPPAPKASPTPAPRSAKAEPASSATTRIASGSKVDGEISGAAELVVDGQVEGKIDLDSRLVVGPNGNVRGEVKARSIQIGGRVFGNVHGLERVEILASGRLEGDMVAPQNGVHIAEGAFFSGKIDMTRGQSQGKNQQSQGKNQKSQGGAQGGVPQGGGGSGGGGREPVGAGAGAGPGKGKRK